MRCEVLAVGTELLLGQIVDTNSAWLGEQLALAGIDRTHGQTVGDNLGRIVGALELALSRADAVIVCGGLGPTQDDITRDAIAAVMGVPLVRDDAAAERIRERFAARGRRMPANNMRQALVPQGATAVAEPQPGTAPGLICPVGDKVVYAVPGCPTSCARSGTGRCCPTSPAGRGRWRSSIADPAHVGRQRIGLASGWPPHGRARPSAVPRPHPRVSSQAASRAQGANHRKADDEATAARLIETEDHVVAPDRRHSLRRRRRDDGARRGHRAVNRGLNMAVAEVDDGGLVARDGERAGAASGPGRRRVICTR